MRAWPSGGWRMLSAKDLERQYEANPPRCGSLENTAVLIGVTVSCEIPVRIGAQLIAQDARISQGEIEALAECWVAGAGCIADESHSSR